MKFTDSSIKALKAKKTRYEVWETNGRGFGMRVSPYGRKTFIFLYRYNGLNRRMTLGTYPEMKLVEAHAAHSKARELLAKGIDPGREHTEGKAADRKAFTVADLVDEYLEKWARPHKKSWKEDERMLKKDVVPVLGRRKAKDIKRRDIVTLLDKLVARGCTVTANRTLGVIRKMFNFGVGRSVLHASPCVQIPAPVKETRRDRALNEKEIKKFWGGLDNARMAETTKLVLRLMLVTAQRKIELVESEWRDFDINKRWWTIPGPKTKNGLPHRVPLSNLATDILTQLKGLYKGSAWLFPSPRGDKPITRPSVDYAVRRNSEYFGIDHFVPHDLRRTAASMMTSAEIPRLTVKKILNHAEGDVTSIYDRHSYDKEKRHALEAWGRKLEQIISGEPAKSKVIELKRK